MNNHRKYLAIDNIIKIKPDIIINTFELIFLMEDIFVPKTSPSDKNII